MLFFLLNLIRHVLGRLAGWFRPPHPPPPIPPVGPPRQVVVLGGGVAGVCAAFWLSAPQQRGRYQVTLYTQGWRLGGKCASGRNQEFDRIEEHGLHILLGCYHNAFATIRACYDEWQRPASHPFQSWRDAIQPQRSVTLMDKDQDGWSIWDIPDFPIRAGQPGDDPAALAGGMDDAYLSLIDVLHSFTPHMLPNPAFALALIRLRDAVTIADDTSRTEARDAAMLANAGLLLEDTALPPEGGQDLRRIMTLAALGLVIAAGYVADVLGGPDDAIDQMNAMDFRDWLRSHNADEATVTSAPVRAVYDLAFAYAQGDASHPAAGTIAAGVTLRFILELVFCYRDAPLWRMVAGTGDTVFVPFYQVLQQRGVAIEFFHRVTALTPSEDGSALETITLARQVATADGVPYEPFRQAGPLQAWPNEPKWELLDTDPGPTPPNYELLSCTDTVGPSITLRAGQDFDVAVVALPPAVLETVAAPLASVSGAWQIALEGAESVPTRAMQLWLRPDVTALGWSLPAPVLTSYAEPFDSWGDMTVVLDYEAWPTAEAPGSIAYFCGCLKVGTKGDPALSAQTWLESNVASIWPNASHPSGWADPGSPMLRRYDRFNTDRAELYVQTPPGSNVSSRFRPELAAGFANLFVVGDWTRTRFSGGCFESAVESAMLASHGISGYPARASIKTA